ncbi:polysaccharide pyruvyl transferase family protein [Shewanella sp. GutCb]|uniref:polysaccharide pyruvyl transferase family protein n=1 Tax=Shewanella sp. GutCb TaxID=2058315 RepID=UPI000C7C33E3|nr:polysaccharide pyruvyl transferase family protein [Shewanella sp. GutCb]PKG75760.1 polysaccharide pyruvyl transferase family protein [Shewanella sp. GutCb]
MKIKTITCHDVYNHGATLQAYALMTYLSQQGHDVEIIDYKPEYLSRNYKLTVVNNPRFSTNLVIKCLYLSAKLPSRLRSRTRKWAFDVFNKKHLKLTERYSSHQCLQAKPPSADAYICGSDQIWNTLHANGKDPAFYLDFGSQDVKKIAYAASLATDKIHNGYEGFVFSKVSNIDHIACRESSGVGLINQLGINNVTHVMDPAFLLDEKQWNEIATKQFPDKYLLVYDFESSDRIKEKALSISKENNWKIYTVNPGKFAYADKRFDNVGPDVFLSLVRDAQLVISNSFHAVVFPLIFKIPFIIEHRSEGINARMEDIFKTINEESKYHSGDVVNYTNEINEILLKKIKVSRTYLLESIACCKRT